MLSVWKSALELFVHNKNMINKKHEFAIVILKESAQWVSVCVCVHALECVCVCV